MAVAQEYSAGIIVFTDTVSPGKRLYLLLHYTSGHWDFAKGHIEGAETKEEAAYRELFEEAGIHATLFADFMETIQYWLTNKRHERVKKEVYFFVGRAIETEVKLSHEHIDFAWLSYTQAMEWLTYQNARDILTLADEFLRLK